LRLTAPDVTVLDHPKVCSIGSSRTPTDDRNAAAATSAIRVTAATDHAR
jgi:hypothetical protein